MSAGKELLLLFSVLFLPGMLGQSFGVDPSAFTRVAYLVQILAISVPQILLVIVIADMRLPGSAARIGWRRPAGSDLVTALLGLVAAWLAAILASLIAVLLAGDSAADGAVGWVFDRYELIPLMLLATLAIGYREEIFYRAYLCDRAEELGVAPRTMLYGGALVFGVGHLYQGIGGFLVSLAVGVALAEVYLQSRSLHGIAVAHGLYNFIALLQAGAAS